MKKLLFVVALIPSAVAAQNTVKSPFETGPSDFQIQRQQDANLNRAIKLEYLEALERQNYRDSGYSQVFRPQPSSDPISNSMGQALEKAFEDQAVKRSMNQKLYSNPYYIK